MKFKKLSTSLQGYLIIILLFTCTSNHKLNAQRTALDGGQNSVFYRLFRQFSLKFIGRSGNDARNLQLNKERGNFQKQFNSSVKFFCDEKNGPGKRSTDRPTNINELRPGDIDIITGMGDSLTAGNGIAATNLLHVTVENRGMSWSIGGQGAWQKYLTLPNILKMFNPNLYGYALKDSLSIERASRFNVAELGAMSRDMPYQAQVLVQRLLHDPKVNMTRDWKLLTLLIGNNDFCSDMCYYDNPWTVIEMHEKHMLKTLRYLRDNVPRLMVNILPAPDVSLLLEVKGKPQRCYKTQSFECPCFVGKSKEVVKLHKQIIKAWVKKDFEVAYRPEFNTKDFTVNVQPFTTNLTFPTLKNGLTDFSYFSMDCFHLSQRAHARSANAIWNNMLDSEGKKFNGWYKEFEVFNCPTKQKPYLATRDNSK